VRDRRAAVEQHAARLHRLAAAAVDRGRERLGAAAARLEAGSPIKLLARGWSVSWLADVAPAEGADGGQPAPVPAALKSVAGVVPGAGLVTQLSDGRIWSRVERTDDDALPQ
jgi:exonuclease VII large subunit